MEFFFGFLVLFVIFHYMAAIKKTDEVPVPELVRPFYWFVGVNRLVIACRVESGLFTPVTQSCDVGDRSLVGSPVERVTAATVVDVLNRDWIFERSKINSPYIVSLFRGLCPSMAVAA